MVIIDARGLIVGRMATRVAKMALLGEKINIVNCDEAVITGNKRQILDKFKQKQKKGIPKKGPFVQKRADKIVRRTIRGMLPYKQNKGKNAFKRIMCYVGIPAELKDKKFEIFKEACISKVPSLKYLKIKDISKFLGAK